MVERHQHPYRQDASPDDSEFDAFERNLRRSHRRAQRRLAVTGLLVLLGGISVLLYGFHLQHQQQENTVQFLLPTNLILVGAIAGLLGTILMLASLISRLRARRQ